MHYVKGVTYIDDYKLRIIFEDNEMKEVNLEPYLDGEIFQPLRDKEYFKQVKVNPDIDTICWDNGADISPEFLYEQGKNV